MATFTLAQVLAKQTIPGELYTTIPDKPNWVQCYACGHRCRIPEGKPGVCKVRFNENGLLRVPHGYVSGLQVDPIEKKPFFHVLPGKMALSFGMLGCDFHCSYCQNWHTSQVLRDPSALAYKRDITAAEIVEIAVQNDAPMITSTYNEPLITSEWAKEIFQLAKTKGLKCSYVSNGNATEEVLDYLHPYIDAYKVDLKTFQDRQYRKLGGKLETITTTIDMLIKKGFWVEVVTLIVPGFNDSIEELTDIAQFLANVSVDIPWHVTAFRKNYKMTDPDNTPPPTLLKAVEIGKVAGLKFVYAGNLPGALGNNENTYCPTCQTLLIKRVGFRIIQNQMNEDGLCPNCGINVAGIWG